MTVKELLSAEEKWCKGAFARDADGDSVVCSHPDAVSWCLVGALGVCYHGEGLDAARQRLRSAIQKSHGISVIVDFNDLRTTQFKDIRRVVELAGV